MELLPNYLGFCSRISIISLPSIVIQHSFLRFGDNQIVLSILYKDGI